MSDPIESLSAREVAQLLRVHPRRVYQLAAAGVLPCVRLGRRSVRFRRAALERWAQAQEMRVIHGGVATERVTRRPDAGGDDEGGRVA